MTDRFTYEDGKNYYIDVDGNRVEYDPLTSQPPKVYGLEPFTEADINEDEVIDDDGFITHYHHGGYEPVTTDPVNPPIAVANAANMYGDGLTTEEGKFHIRYYGTIQHVMALPPDIEDPDGEHGLFAITICEDDPDHLHTDVHTYKPITVLGDANCFPGQRVRVDIQDWDNVILDYIYNYPYQLFTTDYTDNPDDFKLKTFVELGQWDGNKKMRLGDFLEIVNQEFSTTLGTLRETLERYVRDRDWIEKVPTQVSRRLAPEDGACLPYSHLPMPGVTGDFTYNPATRIASLMLDHTDYIIKPKRDDERIYVMQNPTLLKAGTIPEAMRPKENLRLTSYATCSIRTGCSEVVEEDMGPIDLVIVPDGSVRVDGNLYFQHHELGRPGVKENDRWRVEIAAKGGAIFL